MTIGTKYTFLVDGIECEMRYYSDYRGHNFHLLRDGVPVEAYTFNFKPKVGEGFKTSGKHFKRIN